jgi:hypothetical protein
MECINTISCTDNHTTATCTVALTGTRPKTGCSPVNHQTSGLTGILNEVISTAIVIIMPHRVKMVKGGRCCSFIDNC